MNKKFAVSPNEDDYLEPDDVLMFVIHDNPGNTLGQIHGVSEDGIFSFPPDIVPGTRYFISAVAGSNLDCSGNVNPDDPCLSVSQGVPVVFSVCDPIEQNIPRVLIDKDDFESSVSSDTLYDQSYRFQPGKISTRSLSHSMRVTDNVYVPWESILPEYTDAIIHDLHVYDLLGRQVLRQKYIPLDPSALDLSTDILNSTEVPFGMYVYHAEIKQDNGEVIFAYGRIYHFHD
jgi:hypothetical protein